VPPAGHRRDGTRAGPPLVTYAVIAVCVAVFFGLQSAGGRGLSIDFLYRWGFVPERLFTLGNPGAAWTLLTTMFLHGSVEHLVINMICLWSFGRMVEPWLGPIRYALLYVAAGVAGSVAHGLMTGDPRVPVVGASGAIAGVFAAAVFVAPRAIVFLGPIPMPLFVALGVVLLLHVAALVFEWDVGIAWWAHLGGFAVGLAVAPILRRWLTS
jgi:membrane associated rhomboid family serine protease